MLRRTLAAMLLLVFAPWLTAQPLDPTKAKADDKLLWYDILNLDVEGKGWTDTKSPFDRFPAKAEGKVRDAVWNLSRDSAGMCVRFVTDSPVIQARWTLTKANLAMPHMPATGVSGLDLYIRDAKSGKWRWLGVGQPRAQTNTLLLASGIPAGKHEFMLYLPLYNGVTSVEIGIAKEKSIEKAPPYPKGQQKPIVFYGTSITQGGCASRPGMVHTSIIARKLDCPVINLGFSGNGKMEEPVVDLMTELDASIYVIDCLPNMSAAEVTKSTGPLVEKLRKAHPDVPIVLVEDRSYTNSVVLPGPRQRNETSRAALKAEYQKLIDAKVTKLFYIEGEKLLGDDGEGTVDSSHPTDLGFMRQADAFIEVLTPILKR